ncbi:hypothetical protein J2741_000247 [Methanolinea mesophila]|uniref:hypothetical protein n=1 Tax=Methanolinea mesophila TaxID=547055 RepID=UPI001AEA1C4E|nr:hypothetical protein [Methanolinea mesophila]MBP1927700.1 hypothetical protein [Methanolinea mesophila]
MKNIVLITGLTSILCVSILFVGCLTHTYRGPNPDICVTADFQYNGTYVKNYVDAENKYLITVTVFNNSNFTAKNVKIEQFSYCNNQNDFPFRNCISDNRFLADIGDLKPKETKIRYYNFERSALIVVINEKYNLTYSVTSEYSARAPD